MARGREASYAKHKPNNALGEANPQKVPADLAAVKITSRGIAEEGSVVWESTEIAGRTDHTQLVESSP